MEHDGKQYHTLKCTACGASLTTEKEQGTITCPYCRTSQLITESEKVQIERIRSDAYKKVSMERLQSDERMEEKRLINGKKAIISQIVIRVLLVILAFVNCIYLENLIKDEAYLVLIPIGVTVVAIIISWINSSRKKNISGAARKLAIITLVIGYFITFGTTAPLINDRQLAKFEWSNVSRLSNSMPIIESEHGYYTLNNDDFVSMTIFDVSPETYSDYVVKCKNAGYTTIEKEDPDGHFRALDQAGNEISLIYLNGKRELRISLIAPEE